MYVTTSLFFIYSLAFVIQAFAQPTEVEKIVSKPDETVRNSAKQSQNANKRNAINATRAGSILPQALQISPNDAFQSLSNIHIESAADVDVLIKEIEGAADNIYNSEMANIQSWSQDQILAPFQSQAEEGLTIARDRLKESAQKLRSKAIEAIENAQANMTPEEFSRYMKELQQVIEIELAPTRQYFMDAAEAITQVSKETASRGSAATSSSRGSQSRKKNSSAKTTNVPVATNA